MNKALVFAIEEFSVFDGPGIRTSVFIKGCPLRCEWCHNPEGQSFGNEILRSPNGCIECGACEANAIFQNGKLSFTEESINACPQGLLRYCATEYTPQVLCEKLQKNFPILNASGGGVTFSGGEAMLQAAALVPLAKRLKEKGVSVLVDTAGCVPYASFQALNPFVSGYLFDFKTADAAKYQELGGDLSTVTDNIMRLRADGMAVQIRIPLIPQFNTDTAAIQGICAHLRGMGITHVELLPFHRLGGAKYEAMGLSYAYGKEQPLTREPLKEIEAIYNTYFTVKTER